MEPVPHLGAVSPRPVASSNWGLGDRFPTNWKLGFIKLCITCCMLIVWFYGRRSNRIATAYAFTKKTNISGANKTFCEKNHFGTVRVNVRVRVSVIGLGLGSGIGLIIDFGISLGLTHNDFSFQPVVRTDIELALFVVESEAVQVQCEYDSASESRCQLPRVSSVHVLARLLKARSVVIVIISSMQLQMSLIWHQRVNTAWTSEFLRRQVKYKKIMEPVPHLVAMSPRPVTTGVCQLGAWRPFSHDLKTVGIFSINSFNVYHWATSPQHKLKVLLHYVTTSDSHFVTRCYL